MGDTSDRVWTLIPTEPYSFLQELSHVVAKWETNNPGRLTRVGVGPILFLASDYAGQHQGSRFATFSFLVADYIYLWLWEEMRNEVRARYLPDGRRMAFKSLKDGNRQRALAPFLRAANTIPGILLTVAVNKTVLPTLAKAYEQVMKFFQNWKPSSVEKLGLIVGTATVLVAGLADPSDPSQHVLWITDEDDILPNEVRAGEALDVLALLFNKFVPHSIGDVWWATSGRDDGTRSVEDLVAIPDLAGGAIAELLTKSSFAYHEHADQSFLVEPDLQEDPSEKTQAILDWYIECHHPLTRFTVVIDASDSVPYRIWLLDLAAPEQRKPEYDWSYEGLTRITKSLGVYDKIMADLDRPYMRLPSPKFDQDKLLKAINAIRGSRVMFGNPD